MSPFEPGNVCGPCRAKEQFKPFVLAARDIDSRLAKFDELLPKLIRLCHPDKHGNSALANSVTQELLKLKDES